jgi:hypothetical protein
MKVPFAARLATAVLVLGAVGGCSGNSDPKPDPDPTERSASESEPTDGETTEATSEVEVFCASFIELDKEGDESIPVEQVGDEIASLVENAPEELAPDVGVISSSYQALVEAIETAGYDISVLTDDTQLTAEEQAQIQTEAEANGYDREASDAAAENIEVWAGENCEGYVPEEEPSADAPSTGAPAGDVEAACGAYQQLNGGITAEESLEQFKILVDNAPPEISADTVTLQAGVVAYIDAVEAAGFDMSVLDDQSKLNKKEQTAYNDALEAANVDFEAAQAAATNLNNWATANC